MVTPTRLSSDCLHLSDVSADLLPYPSFVRFFIKVSKADPFRQSCTVIVGRNGSLLCPVEALLRYLHLRGSRPGPPLHFSEWDPSVTFAPEFIANYAFKVTESMVIIQAIQGFSGF